MHTFNTLITVIIFLYFGLYILFLLFSKKDCKTNNPFDNLVKYFPPSFFALVIAFGVYLKVDDILKAHYLLQISDRCIAAEVDTSNILFARFTHQGGDAFAYEKLLYNLDNSNGEFRNDIKNQLVKIYGNLESLDEYFKTSAFPVCRSNSTSWIYKYPQEKKEGKCQTEEWIEFDVVNVVDQLRHPKQISWGTRAKAAKLLQNIESLKVLDPANLEIIKNFNWERLFDSLIWNINHDHSLIVRKISLDTYKIWACINVERIQDKQQCENRFLKDGVYNFQATVNHWSESENKLKVVDNLIKFFKLDDKKG